MPEGNQLLGGISPILTDMAISLMPDLTTGGDLIAMQLFPNIPVGAPTGQYNVWAIDDFLRIEMKRLGNREAPPVIDVASSKSTYNTANFGVSADWTDRELAEARATAISAQNFINAKVGLVTNNGLLALEQNTATLVQSPTNWTGQYQGVSANPSAAQGQFLQWDQVGSDPVQDVVNWKRNFKNLTGYNVNTMVLPGLVWDKLQFSPSLIERIKYTGTQDNPSVVTLAMLQGLFGGTRPLKIFTPDQVYNAAPKGLPKSIQPLWGKGIWMGYVAPTASDTLPSAGYHFTWTGNTGQGLPNGVDAGGAGPQAYGSVQNEYGLFVRRYDTVRPVLHCIDSELWTQPNVTSADLGLYAQTVVS